MVRQLPNPLGDRLVLDVQRSPQLVNVKEERRHVMSDQPALDQAKMEAFVHKVFGDTSAALTTTLAALGDRLGLFKDLAANGPATSVELAARTGIHERYAREWLGGMASAGYLAYDPTNQRFSFLRRTPCLSPRRAAQSSLGASSR